ncbi:MULTISPECIES: methylaspartate mutase [unclassified Streptomyces]|uniref:methylaspartate mutase n=1 Tax=unclassified Streptomyces TaxID=2593676 RepID=UPI002E2CD27B|nr:methylaspartate mutase [Streptomyces sp. NBC_00223]
MTRFPAGPFGGFVARAQQEGCLVVQPRMGFADPVRMRAGLLAVRDCAAMTVGTVTLDSYTRLGRHLEVRRLLDRGGVLNGYPLVAHGHATNLAMLDGVLAQGFPVQVRHGSALPQDIVTALTDAGLDATEGGPVSYCLPYGRTPLRTSVRNWAEGCALLDRVRERGVEPHLETFGGCMTGQMCPPSLLVALSVLEALFFRWHGIRSLSLSYAQQTDAEQDRQAVAALRGLAGRLLGDTDWHIVVYTYMGVYPRTRPGALALLEEAARLAVRTGAARLIVKTVAEAHRIPTIAENVQALETAALAAAATRPAPPVEEDNEVLAEASLLVEHVLSLADDPGEALLEAFARGHLDVPYCLHPDNRGASRSYLDSAGWLRWSRVGAMPLPPSAESGRGTEMTSRLLLASLSHVQNRFDRAAARGARPAGVRSD